MAGDYNADLLGWLCAWYKEQCNGDWEHSYGVELGTLDNPGWSLRINLAETSWEGRAFAPVEIKRTEEDWLFCKVEQDCFEAACGPLNLPEVVQIFRVFVEAVDPN